MSSVDPVRAIRRLNDRLHSGKARQSQSLWKDLLTWCIDLLTCMIYWDCKMQKPFDHGPGKSRSRKISLAEGREKILVCLFPSLRTNGYKSTRTGTNLTIYQDTGKINISYDGQSSCLDFPYLAKEIEKTQPFLSLTNLPNEKQKRTFSASPFFW